SQSGKYCTGADPCSFECGIFRDRSKDQVDILRPLSEPSHEICIPLVAKRDIDTYIIAPFNQLGLKFLPETIEHLELKFVVRDIPLIDEIDCIVDDVMVMRGDRSEAVTFCKMDTDELFISSIDVILFLQSHPRVLLVCPLYETCPAVFIFVYIFCRIIKVGLQHCPDVIIILHHHIHNLNCCVM